jgi:lipoprotein-anchoring transpeptidase ErfK/SrfK
LTDCGNRSRFARQFGAFSGVSGPKPGAVPNGAVPAMPSLAFAARALAGASLAAVMLLATTGPGSTRDRAHPPVRVAPDLEREWLLQLSPGSGAVPGYRRPDLAARATNPQARAYPGYAAAVPGVQPGYAVPAGMAAQPGARRYGFPAPGATRLLDRGTTGGLFGAARRPAARQAQPPRFDPALLPQEVDYRSAERPGTVIIDTEAKFLYLVEEGGRARRYGVGVGKPGFEWAGRHQITRKSEWPTWTPPEQMRERERAKGRILPVSMSGGPENPLGARAMYLGSTLYRIHGTNQPWTIGKAVSSGCIRMRNEDVTDLYERVPVGTSVVVL